MDDLNIPEDGRNIPEDVECNLAREGPRLILPMEEEWLMDIELYCVLPLLLLDCDIKDVCE